MYHISNKKQNQTDDQSFGSGSSFSANTWKHTASL